MRLWVTFFKLAFSSTIFFGQAAFAQAELTADEAVRLAFSDCKARKENLFLTEDQLAAVKNKAGHAMPSRLVSRYVALCAGAQDGYAYIDVHQVRTKNETLMVVIDKESKIRRVEVLNFSEPPEYKPKSKWYELFSGKELNAELNVKRSIAQVAGSTLTARATTQAARRILALHLLLNEDSSTKRLSKP